MREPRRRSETEVRKLKQALSNAQNRLKVLRKEKRQLVSQIAKATYILYLDGLYNKKDELDRKIKSAKKDIFLLRQHQTGAFGLSIKTLINIEIESIRDLTIELKKGYEILDEHKRVERLIKKEK